MVEATYDEALRRLLIHEGGYTNHPADPGGPTNFGITIHDYRAYKKPDASAEDVRRMALQDAKDIYRSKYWDAMRCDEIPAGLDYAVFDYGVNSGIGRAAKVLHRLVDLPDSAIMEDAVIAKTCTVDPTKALIIKLCSERLAFLQSLRTWPTFGAGWGRRVAEVQATAVKISEVHGAPTGEKAGSRPAIRPAPTAGPISPDIQTAQQAPALFGWAIFNVLLAVMARLFKGR